MTPESDRALVTRARGGDAAAYAVLLARHRAALLRACRRGPVADEAADLAQDAALVAWLQLDRLRDPDRFGAWLAGIGRILALRAARARAAARERPTVDGALPERVADERDDPAERVLARERAGELASALAALPDGQRDAVVLFHVAGLPQRAVAERLGTAAGAVRTRLHKARAALRARLATDHEEPMPATAIPARIVDVRRTPAGRHVVILAAGEDELPIWIGVPEAESLVAELQGVELPRPGAHALALSLLHACGRAPARVRIARLDEAVFYAEVVLDDGAVVDARPSDALVLAVASGAALEIERDVLEATRRGAPEEYADDLSRAAEGAALLAGELRAELAARRAEIDRLRDA